MKVIIAGGTGFLGHELSQFFTQRNDEVVVLTRGASRTEHGLSFVHWDATTLGDWKVEFSDADVLINLSGKSVDCRFTEKNKKEILRSRIDATKVLGKAVKDTRSPLRIWINASAATIYDYSEDKARDEDSTELGHDFAKEVAQAWEDTFYEADTPNVRKVALRISVVLGKRDGAYPVLKRLGKFGLAGTMGPGTQRFAWVHIQDLLRMIEFAIVNDSIRGPLNCAAPETPTNKTFLKALRVSLGVPIGIPQPTFLLKIGGFIIGTESDLILKSRWVSPKKLLENGFEFTFSDLQSALNDLAQ